MAKGIVKLKVGFRSKHIDLWEIIFIDEIKGRPTTDYSFDIHLRNSQRISIVLDAGSEGFKLAKSFRDRLVSAWTNGKEVIEIKYD